MLSRVDHRGRISSALRMVNSILKDFLSTDVTSHLAVTFGQVQHWLGLYSGTKHVDQRSPTSGLKDRRKESSFNIGVHAQTDRANCLG